MSFWQMMWRQFTSIAANLQGRWQEHASILLIIYLMCTYHMLCKYLEHTDICYPALVRRIFIVEVAGVEPASKVMTQRTSTHIVCFCFDLKIPDRQGSL